MAKYRLAKGSKPAVKCTFTDPEDVSAPLDTFTGHTLVDPSTVTAAVKPPTGSPVTYTYLTDSALSRDSQGRYRLIIDLALQGAYHIKWTGVAGSRKIVQYTDIDSYVEAGL